MMAEEHHNADSSDEEMDLYGSPHSSDVGRPPFEFDAFQPVMRSIATLPRHDEAQETMHGPGHQHAPQGTSAHVQPDYRSSAASTFRLPTAFPDATPAPVLPRRPPPFARRTQSPPQAVGVTNLRPDTIRRVTSEPVATSSDDTPQSSFDAAAFGAPEALVRGGGGRRPAADLSTPAYGRSPASPLPRFGGRAADTLPAMMNEDIAGPDSGSDEEEDPEAERLRRRAEAIASAEVNLRCMRDECALDPWMVTPPTLSRQKACMYQELVQLPCGSCGRLQDTVIRY